jgi:hypothetical protein
LANSNIQELSREKSKTSQEGGTERKDRTSDILKDKENKNKESRGRQKDLIILNRKRA